MTRGRYRWALAVVAVSAFMITMDNTVVANALPTIMSDLDMSNSAKDWVATGYILMFSCLMVAGGRLTDVFGCRVTFVSGMVVFTAASAVCGLAPDSATLILARVTQGAGAALALPATQVMVTVGRTDKQRSLGTIVWVGAGSSATALGPTIGGFIVQQWSWGWIFLINIVPGVLVILLGLVVLTGKGENRDARVDLPGVLISATMLFAFTYGLESGNKHGWADPSVLSVFALAFIALACFVLVESWAPDPMINLRFFRNRVFAGGLLSQMLYGIGFNGMIFYSATFLQRFLGFSPPQAGLVMLPPSIAIMVMTPVAFWLATKLGPRPAIGGGLALMAFGMFLFSTIQQGDGYADLMPGVMIVGVGAAMGMPLVMYVLKAVPEQQAGVASGIINVIREASGAFGIAIVGLLIHHVPEEGASAAELETFRSGTASGLILGAVLVLIGGLISGLTLPSRRGWLGPKHGKSSPLVEPAPRRPASPPRDPVPALTAPVAVATPPGEPLPLPLTWEEDPMPDPTPGPHWWTDTPKPQDDTSAWTTETPWPPPPPTPNPWKDWPTPEPPPGTPGTPPTEPLPAPSETPFHSAIPVSPPRRATAPSPDAKAPPSAGSQDDRDIAGAPDSHSDEVLRQSGSAPASEEPAPGIATGPLGLGAGEDTAPLGQSTMPAEAARPEGGAEGLLGSEGAGVEERGERSAGHAGAAPRREPAISGEPAEPAGSGEALAGGSEGVVGGGADSPAEGAGAGSAGEGSVEADEAEEGDGGRPAPPEGWYEPYVPEKEPVEDPHIVPRSDAW
ncbi:MDR family MFS transporter [Actinomadura mexicana]|uniref:MDR family MFS transporter n=1 Tax=Actinomadura mexicana TaxID=134959 RepID=UPI001178079B|nr:MFS transporter [Actinomadura mexicana]